MTKTNSTTTTTTTTTNTNTSDVLFQKLGNTWFIFSEIEGEIIYSAMPAGMDPRDTKLELYNIIEEHMKKVARNRVSEAQVA
jgi:hypothetical protein